MTVQDIDRRASANAKRLGPTQTNPWVGCDGISEHRGSFIGLSLAVLIGTSLSGAATAGERARAVAAKPANKAVVLKWKGANLAAYGTRFKAALKLQAREARKPSWSWRCEERDTVAMKTN